MHNYNQIQYGKSKEEKAAANQFIVQFIASEQVWTISLELLSYQPPQNQSQQQSFQEHFIGAQALFQKLDKNFGDLAQKDAHVVELRDKLFELMRPAAEGEAEKPTYHKMVLERLSMCVAYIALNTTNTCWTNSVQDIITYGASFGPMQCFISFSILKHICIVFESK